MSVFTARTLDDGLMVLSSAATFSRAATRLAAITMPVAPARAQTFAAAYMKLVTDVYGEGDWFSYSSNSTACSCDDYDAPFLGV